MPVTWDILPTLGLIETADRWSDGKSYEIDLGVFTLTAAQRMNRYFRDVVMFDGYYVTEMAIGEVHFELPLQVASADQCKAFIAYYLRNHVDHKHLGPDLEWIREGWTLAHLLPWEADRHEARAPSRAPELIWKEIMELVALALEDNETRMRGEMEMRAAGDPSMLLLKLGCMEPSRVLQLICKNDPGINPQHPHEATPEEKERIVSAVLDLFSAN